MVSLHSIWVQSSTPRSHSAKKDIRRASDTSTWISMKQQVIQRDMKKAPNNTYALCFSSDYESQNVISTVEMESTVPAAKEYTALFDQFLWQIADLEQRYWHCLAALQQLDPVRQMQGQVSPLSKSKQLSLLSTQQKLANRSGMQRNALKIDPLTTLPKCLQMRDFRGWQHPVSFLKYHWTACPETQQSTIISTQCTCIAEEGQTPQSFHNQEQYPKEWLIYGVVKGGETEGGFECCHVGHKLKYYQHAEQNTQTYEEGNVEECHP